MAIGTIGGNPLPSQLQAYGGVKPADSQQQNPNDKLKPASETNETAASASATPTSGESRGIKADTSERAYDSGGVSANGGQRGGTLDITV